MLVLGQLKRKGEVFIPKKKPVTVGQFSSVCMGFTPWMCFSYPAICDLQIVFYTVILYHMYLLVTRLEVTLTKCNNEERWTEVVKGDERGIFRADGRDLLVFDEITISRKVN